MDRGRMEIDICLWGSELDYTVLYLNAYSFISTALIDISENVDCGL